MTWKLSAILSVIFLIALSRLPAGEIGVGQENHQATYSLSPESKDISSSSGITLSGDGKPFVYSLQGAAPTKGGGTLSQLAVLQQFLSTDETISDAPLIPTIDQAFSPGPQKIATTDIPIKNNPMPGKLNESQCRFFQSYRNCCMQKCKNHRNHKCGMEMGSCGQQHQNCCDCCCCCSKRGYGGGGGGGGFGDVGGGGGGSNGFFAGSSGGGGSSGNSGNGDNSSSSNTGEAASPSDTPVDTTILVPEPSMYLLLGVSLGVGFYLSKTRRVEEKDA